MRINFVLPFVHKTGGVLVVFEHAANLARMGHDVRIYHPLWPYGSLLDDIPRGPRRLYHQARRAFLAWRARRPFWAPEARPVAVPCITAPFLRDADVIVATAWPTAYSVAAMPRSKGAKLYFIQDYERWFRNLAAVDGSYRLPLRPIVIAPWLRELLTTRFGRADAVEVRNGVDLAVFRRDAAPPPGPVSVLMMWHRLESKGSADGLETLRQLRASRPGVKVRMFGMYPPPGEDWIDYRRDPSREDLAKLYRESHIFLHCSRQEGWGLPVLEAMASGCAVVASDSGCVPVVRGEGNLLVFPPGDREAMLTHLERLVDDEALRTDIAERGWREARKHGWEESTRRLETILREETEHA